MTAPTVRCTSTLPTAHEAKPSERPFARANVTPGDKTGASAGG